MNVTPHSCVLGQRPKWRPWGFCPAGHASEGSRKVVRPEGVTLEVFVRVLVPSDIHDAWKYSFKIDATLPIRPPVSQWVGGALGLRGELVLCGERFSRCIGSHIQWKKQDV